MTELTATIDTRHLLDALKRAETVRQDHHVRAIATVQIHFGEKSKVAAYRSLWNRINGADAWDANPWVDVTKFDVLHQNVQGVAA